MFSLAQFISACIVCNRAYHADPAICPDCIALLQKYSRVGDNNLQVFSHDWHKLRVLGAYENILADLIKVGKFNDQPHLFKQLARLFSDLLVRQDVVSPRLAGPLDAANGVIIPVPMPRLRYLLRGYNQADIIARELARRLALPYQDNVLRQHGDRVAQHRLKRRERLAPTPGKFRLIATPPERLILVDDVMTTGATAASICRLFKAAGVQYIEVWVLALTANM